MWLIILCPERKESMAGYHKSQKLDRGKLEEKSRQEVRKELMARLTAPSHVTVSSYKEHGRIEGYYEFDDYKHLFKCDRLLKIENQFGKIQMGYNPNRGRSFIFATMKTSRYDTIASEYQKGMKEYNRRSERKTENENRAYTSARKKSAAVMIEKAENKPWSENSMQQYLNRVNMDALGKTMPFFQAYREQSQLISDVQEMEELRQQIREQSLEGKWELNQELNKRLLMLNKDREMLQAILYRKDAAKRGFVRKVNYAFDIEKKEMFHYYREERKRMLREMAEDALSENGQEEDAQTDGQKG